ncbi:MAG: DNA-directed RNA polymerase subunit omega [Candidatus Jidaibacter sp.]|nr:DNA-directed RNA polymerase subunit omega [Candidatus Jidaibacter sp.]
MARVTIEDCTKVVPSRFELVILAAQRAKDIVAGSKITVERHNDKNAVVALREISLGNIDVEELKEEVIKKHQRFHQADLVDSPEENDLSEDHSEIISEVKSLVSQDIDESDLYEEEAVEEEV